MTLATEVSVRRLAGALGAEVHGLDLAALTDEAFDRLHRLLMEHQVLFVPDQRLDPDQHRELAGRFGDVENHPFSPKLDAEHPEVVVLRSDDGAIADVWHTDVTFSSSPPICSVLHMIECPAYGGDTMWTNQAAVYAALSAPLQELLLGLTAIHTAAVFGHPETQAEHPVVRRHPETGQPSLFVNRQFTKQIVQLSPDESDALLHRLYSFSEQPPFTVRYSWAPSTVAIWDNRITQHYVVNDFAEPRVLHRVTVLGDHPQPAGDTTRWPAWKPARLSAATADSGR